MHTQSLGGPPAVDQDSFFALADVRQPAGQRRIGWARLKRNCISYCDTSVLRHAWCRALF